MMFDVIELITFVFTLIAFIFILIAYFKSRQKSKKLWACFLIIACFILLNRLFTNIEALAFKNFFNLLEHLSVAAAALTFVIIIWLVYEGGIK
jgi:hypothetical protein